MEKILGKLRGMFKKKDVCPVIFDYPEKNKSAEVLGLDAPF